MPSRSSCRPCPWSPWQATGNLHGTRGQLLPPAETARCQDRRRKAGQGRQALEERSVDGEYWIYSYRREGHGRQSRCGETDVDDPRMYRDWRENCIEQENREALALDRVGEYCGRNYDSTRGFLNET